jgi:NAD(P)H dehydrogenase (quinone)
VPRFIITGASGYIARHVRADLLARGVPPGELILVTRTPDAIRDGAPGAEVRSGDFTMSEADLQDAYAGGELMLFISPAPESFTSTGAQMAAQQAALAAAKRAGVRHVFMQSRLAAHPDLGGADREATELESTLRSCGMRWTILRTAGFADSRGRDAKRNLQDGYVATAGDPHAPSRYVTRDDIAAAAAAVLQMGDSAGEQVYHLLGPGVSLAQIVEVLSELSGRSLEIRQLDEATYVEELVSRGRLRRIAELAVVNGRRARELGMRLQCDLPRLIGRPGQSLLDFLRANQTELLTGTPQTGREPVLT